MGTSGWEDLAVTPVGQESGRYTATIDDRWMLLVVPQGGVVAAVAARAMATALDDAGQSLRSLTAVFAGQVATGPVEIDVTVLRRGRSMSQLTATVRNPGAKAGLTAVAVFGATRRGFEFTDLTFPDVEAPEGLRSYRDPVPDGVDFEFDRPPMPFWEEIVECRPATGRPPWEPFESGPAEIVYWYRLDQPPLLDDGSLDPVGAIVLCDTMPGAVGQKIGPGTDQWFAPSVDLTMHLFGPARPGWLLGRNQARRATGGYASTDMELWSGHADGDGFDLVAYATQQMLFTFPA